MCHARPRYTRSIVLIVDHTQQQQFFRAVHFQFFAFFARVTTCVRLYAVVFSPARKTVPDTVAGFYTGHDIGQSRHAPGTARFFANKFLHNCTQKKAGPNWTGFDCATNNRKTQGPLLGGYVTVAIDAQRPLG